MHWMMWIFWGFFGALFIGSYVVDKLTKKKYSLDKKEKTLNQSTAEADASRHTVRSNHESGMF
ncbi:hypothetical protein AUC31_05985 [Planococcus rifietoensis]|uniref:Uncharacterized protein n=1 Tax=Planococcus rifietoensis TaxID=200991 RepID=A0A0U2YT74_9BACL|nr:hypothetical protein [Planococcus rifietoensis]ALS74798.1 hypothetical protein AUC31_05985 [Planococcus rifietoensis]